MFEHLTDESLRLGDHARGYDAEILLTKDMVGQLGEGLTRQFTEEAHVHDERYFDLAAKKQVFTKALSLSPMRHAGEIIEVLDIGCGSGNATFPLLELLPACSVLATDLSPQMVQILVTRAKALGVMDRVVPLVSNASTLDLARDSFDLVAGFSMLHHLLEPRRFLRKLVESLRPGGLAVLLEPMTAGHLVVRHFMGLFCGEEHLSALLPDDIRDFFQQFMYTVEVLSAQDRSGFDYAKIDDKWTFSRAFFEECAQENGATWRCFGTSSLEHPFTDKLEELVWMGLGRRWRLPQRLRDMTLAFDASIPRDAFDELATEACVVFAKPL